jgi:hypothetical protein
MRQQRNPHLNLTGQGYCDPGSIPAGTGAISERAGCVGAVRRYFASPTSTGGATARGGAGLFLGVKRCPMYRPTSVGRPAAAGRDSRAPGREFGR